MQLNKKKMVSKMSPEDAAAAAAAVLSARPTNSQQTGGECIRQRRE